MFGKLPLTKTFLLKEHLSCKRLFPLGPGPYETWTLTIVLSKSQGQIKQYSHLDITYPSRLLLQIRVPESGLQGGDNYQERRLLGSPLRLDGSEERDRGATSGRGDTGRQCNPYRSPALFRLASLFTEA